MSTTIDQRVVEMRFDNKHFESNVQTSLSTLDKLKEKLSFKGATKGLENVSTAAKKVDVTGLGTAIESVRTKFSALEVMGVTALANLTNSAVNAGKRIISALTIDPIKTGFSEYETKINSIQTIMSNTASKGTTMEDVTRVIDELNTYADKTIYNFAEMTRNIGTFTAAGVGLEESAAAIKGIANLAAASGSNSQQASTAMYQLSQALAAGTVKLMDWNSVVNAGMGGEKFQEALKATAREHGIAIDSIIKKSGSFRDSLQEEWLSADILNETLRKFTVEGATEYAESMVKCGKYTREQADALIEEARSMEDAATKVKTFTQLWDTLKESAQSGWGKTWEIIFGDFLEARDLFSGLSKFLGGFIDKMSDFRNNLLEGALDLATPWTKIMAKLEGSGLGKIKKVAESVGDMTDKLEHFQDVVNKVWRGDYKNSDTGRYELLEKAGYDHRVVQDLVNKGYQYKLTVEDIEASHKKFGLTMDKTKASTEDVVVAISDLSDEELKNAGLTDEEIKLYRDLAEEAAKTGVSVGELAEEMSKNDGRTLLIDSFKNAGQGLVTILTAIKDAWVEIFPPMSVVQLYNIIKGINEFSTHLRVSDETADKLKRTLKGVFAIIDIIATIAGGAFRIAFNILTQLLGYFNLDILDLTALIGDFLVKIRDWMDALFDFTLVFDVLVPLVQLAAEAIGDFFNSIKNSAAIKKFTSYLANASKSIRDWFEGIKDAENIPKYIIDGLVNGLTSGVKAVWNAALEIGRSVLESVKEFLGIHSPSTKFIEIGKNIVEGLIEGLQNGASGLWGFMKGIASKLAEIISGIDFGALLAVGLGVGMLVLVKDLTNVLDKFAAPLDGLGDMLSGIGNMFEDIGSKFKAQAWEAKSKAILNMAIAIGILAASVALLAKIKVADLIKAGIALGVLAGVMVALAFAANKMGDVGDIGKASLSALGIAGSLLILALAISKLASIDMSSAPSVFTYLAASILGLAGIMIVLSKFIDAGSAVSIGKASGMMIKMSIALMLMVLVIKQAAKLEAGVIFKGLGVIALLEGFFISFVAVSKYAGEHGSKAGGMLLLMSGALLIMIGVIKSASKLEAGQIFKGLGVIAAVELLFIAIVAVSKFAGRYAVKAGGMLLMMSLAMSIMINVVKQASKLEGSELDKAVGTIVKLELLFAGVIAVSRLAGKNAMKAGVMLIAMSGALLIITGILFIISKMDPSGLGRALGVVTVLEILFMGLIAVSSLAADAKGPLIVLVVALGILVTAIAVLSLINPKNLFNATAALTVVVSAFALLIAATHLIKDTKGMYKTLISLLVVVGALTAVVVILANLEVGSALSAATSLSILLISLATAMAIVSRTGTNSMSAVTALVAMGLVVAELAVILGLMSAFNVEASIATAASLSLLLIAMTGVLAVLTLLGVSASSAYAGIAALGVLGLVVAELAVILGLMSAFDVNPSIETAAALSLLLISMSGALVLLGAVGLMGPAALIGIASLAVLIAGIGGLVTAIGYLVTEFPILETFLDTGIPILEKIGYALGSFFGNIVGGFMGNVTSGLPEMANHLSEFMNNLKPFIEGAKSIDATAMEGIKSVAQTILILTAADIMQSLTSWFAGGSSLVDFANQLVPFGKAMAGFSAEVTGKVNAEAVAAAANAGKILAEMAATLPNTGGVAGFFAGENDLITFASQLVPFGKAIAAFSAEVAGKINEDAVVAAANAGKVMSEMAATIPNTGGVAGFFAGENDMATFGSQLIAFGKAITGFSAEVAGKINENAITAAASAGKMMSEMAATIPNTGGLVSFFTGDNDMATFGSQLTKFGKAMNKYGKEVSGLDVDSISTSVKAASSLSKLQNSLGKTGGLLSIFSGDSGLDTFGNNLKKFGKAMKKYSDEVSGINTSNLSGAASEFKKLANIAKGLSGVDCDGFASFGKALGKLGKTGVDKFIKAFSDASDKVSKAGSKLVDNLLKGVKDKDKSVTSAFKKVAENGVDAIRDKYKSFYNAGSYLVSGFANGISENSYKATAKAKAMAKAAKEAAEKALGIASPSKVFYQIGSFTGQGFVNALSDYGSKSYEAGAGIAESAKNGLTRAIGRIQNLIDSGVNVQPTIRPVLDLSDIESGVNSIGSMFGLTPSVGVLSNVGAISSMMNGRIQNGDSSDVVSAINKLRKDLSGKDFSSYNINGVSYNEGSDVEDAIKTIVRAATMERRV